MIEIANRSRVNKMFGMYDLTYKQVREHFYYKLRTGIVTNWLVGIEEDPVSYLYFLLDSANIVRYIGVTEQVKRRETVHKRNHPHLTFKKIAKFVSKTTAFQIEMFLIRHFGNQLLNKKYNER